MSTSQHRQPSPAVAKAMRLLTEDRPVTGMKHTELTLVNCSDIQPSRYQPRSEESLLAELPQLIEQIKADPNGILQPPTVIQLPNGKYELISGERRLRAWMSLGNDQILVIIKNTPISDIPFAALIENVQRLDLTCGEISRSIQKIKSEQDCSDAEIHRKTGISKAQLSRYTAIAKLMEADPYIEKALLGGRFELPLLKISDALRIFTSFTPDEKQQFCNSIRDALANEHAHVAPDEQQDDENTLKKSKYDFYGYLMAFRTGSSIPQHGEQINKQDPTGTNQPDNLNGNMARPPAARVRGPDIILRKGEDWQISRRARGDAIKINRKLTDEQIQMVESLIKSFL